MKRNMIRVLASVLCMCLLCGCAMADNLTLAPRTQLGRARTFHDVASVQDTVWMSVYTDGELQLWRWQPGMEGAEAAAGGLLHADSYTGMEDMLAATAHEVKIPDTAHAVTVLFSDGETLYGLNHHNGLVFTIAVEKRDAVFTDVTTLQDTSIMYRMTGGYRWNNTPWSVACVDGKLLWHYSWREEDADNASLRLRIYDLKDGSSIDVDAQRVEGVCSYKDGKALVLTRESNDVVGESIYDVRDITVNVCDVATGELTPIGMIEDVDHITDAVYSALHDVLLYQSGTSVMGVRDGKGIRFAYLPVQVQGSIDVLGDTVIYVGNGEAHARTLVEGFETEHSVTVLSGVLNNAMTAFTDKFPVVPVYNLGKYSDTEEGLAGYVRLFTSGEDAPDVARMYAADSPFVQLRDGGYLLDLSGYPEIAAYVGQLYPAFREYVTKDGGIYGVPVSAGSYNGFFINRKVMESVGLTAEDVPSNLIDLCAFVTRWNDEFALKYPDYAVLDGVEDYRRSMYDLMMEAWMGYCEAMEQPLHFDDPLLREMLTALMEMKTDKIEQTLKTTNPEKSDYKQGLIWMNCQLVGNFATYMEDFSDRIFIPMTLSKETPLKIDISTLQLYCINAQTDDAEYSVKLLEENIGIINDKYRHILLATETQPVENPYLKSSLAYESDRVATLERRVQQAGTAEERKAMQAELDTANEYIEQMIQENFYTIHPSAIEHYAQVLAPAMYIREPGAQAMNMGDVTTMMDRFLAGEQTVDQFVRQLEAELMMKELQE